MTVSECLNLFARHQILSAPCFDMDNDRYLGFVDVKSILKTFFEVIDVRTMNQDDREVKLYGAGREANDPRDGFVHLIWYIFQKITCIH